MINQLFRYPKVLARHRHAPMVEQRESYLAHLASRGAAVTTLLRLACVLLHIARALHISRSDLISIEEIQSAAKRWARFQRRRHRALTGAWSYRLFLDTAKSWFRFMGRLEEPRIPVSPFSSDLDDYIDALLQTGNLELTTIHNYRWHVRKFFNWLEGEGKTVGTATVIEVDAFLSRLCANGWTRVSVASSGHALRSFFRVADARGWSTPGIADAIETPRLFKEEGLPGGPIWPDVQRLIAEVDTNTPRGLRDRGILLLLANYGLRSGEVRKLRLEDLDWDLKVIRVNRSKLHRTDLYPMTPRMGEAIANYLQRGRPRSSRREVFLTLKAPFRPLSPGAMYHLTRSRLKHQGSSSPKWGPHSLRHACAMHLMSAGFSLQQIGGHLGHRYSGTTSIYAKVDLQGLREVAEFDLGDLL